MIFNSFQDWSDNPVLMTVDTFDSPMQNIEFPAVTLCPSDHFQPDNWALTEQVFNSFEFHCQPGNDVCNELRNDFQPVLRIIFDLVTNTFEALKFDFGSLDGYLQPTGGYYGDLLPSEQLDQIYWAIKTDKLDLSLIDDKIYELMGMKNVELYDHLNLEDGLGIGTEKCDSECSDLKLAIQKLFLKNEWLSGMSHLKLGTLLRQVSNKLGILFNNEIIRLHSNDEMEQCNYFTDVEEVIFQKMKSFAQQFGLKSSLQDIPNVFRNGFDLPKMQFYPLYSICTAGNMFINRLVISTKA